MSSNQVEKRSDKLAEVFLILPVIFFVLGATCFGIGWALARFRRVVFPFLMIWSFIFFGLEILPGSVLSIIGMVRAANAKMTGIFILGIVEVIGALLLAHLVWYIVFVAGPGV